MPDFNASNRWLSQFKTRENIAFKKLHGEKKDAYTDAAQQWISNVLPEITRQYNPKDIYNADETGIYYRAIPNSTHVMKNESVSGSKKCKRKALVCANMDGSDKRRLLIIGKSKEPRCFRGKSPPVTYRANKNAWMTAEIFTDWIREFNREMCKKKRKVILLVDNCSAHPKESADCLNNVRLEFLPPNTTSVIQPCDQGIIRNVKGKYRSEVVKKIISDIDKETLTANDLVKQLTLLDSVHLLNKAWKSVSSSTIANCFRKAGFCNDQCEDREEEENKGTPEGMTAEDFEEFINQDNELQCHHVPTDEDILAEFIDEREPEEDDNEEEDGEDEAEIKLPVTSQEAKEALLTLCRYYEENNKEDFQTIYKLEDECADRDRQQHKETEEDH